MKIAPDSLPNDVDLLKQLLLETLAAKEAEIAALKQSVQRLLEQFRQAQQQRFGVRCERHDYQGELFNEAEVTLEAPVVLTTEYDVVEGLKRRAKRKPLPKDLPREVIVHDIREADKQCDCCGHQLALMGQDSSEKLKFIPAQITVIEHVRLKYSCKHCETQGTKANIKQAPVPASPIPKSFATPSLLSQLITSKYQYALPLYRQETLFKQHGIELNRKTMADWMIKSAALFKPLYDLLHQQLLTQAVIHADETTLKVINDERVKSYMWVYCSGGDGPNAAPRYQGLRNIVLYDYQDGSRAGTCVSRFLATEQTVFNGYLQVDGYAAYQQASNKLVGCWAHARRKFKEALIAQGKPKVGKISKADMALSMIAKLYRIETQIQALSLEERLYFRRTHSRAQLGLFKQWLDKSVLQVSKESPLGKAIHYSLNQWSALSRYTEDSRLNIDNNRAERAVKPFVIGRKNWLFNHNHRGAEASAILYSIIETAKANGLIPFDYIEHCLTQLSYPDCDLHSLLPWQVNLGKA
ncbi:IS66 family transposase [Shewanella glacialipiscicola]|uniref:IS66 family transposase n=5 Tax=Shewanella glacialipiscicola TaxID=614069 RepID=UPI0021DB1E02|nr:IS66 family transposase [Shewanella glacialipiscicola]MCU7996810.1 IS66 family transposase [Shewanella glacialipiscicola]MCU8028123.1 IS66 family transposase [Shewanella glacialipiscicola]